MRFNMPDWEDFNTLIYEILDECYPNIKYYMVERDVPIREWLQWSRCVDTEPDLHMPVSLTNANNTIFGDAYINALYRAWHDSVHHEFGLGFNHFDEIKVAGIQQQQLDKVYTTDEIRRVIEADTLGQTLYHLHHNEFPEDQTEFATRYIYEGMSPFYRGLRV